MTKEDAIDIIKSECYVFNPLNFDRSTMVNTALDMAVKALEQDPCEDCISRKALLKKCIYAPIAPIIKGDVVHYEDIVFARDIINAEPIQQEPKTGRWIDEFGGCECSECGCLEAGHSDYCPNCGAKMEVEENG